MVLLPEQVKWPPYCREAMTSTGEAQKGPWDWDPGTAQGSVTLNACSRDPRSSTRSSTPAAQDPGASDWAPLASGPKGATPETQRAKHAFRRAAGSSRYPQVPTHPPPSRKAPFHREAGGEKSSDEEDSSGMLCSGASSLGHLRISPWVPSAQGQHRCVLRWGEGEPADMTSRSQQTPSEPQSLGHSGRSRLDTGEVRDEQLCLGPFRAAQVSCTCVKEASGHGGSGLSVLLCYCSAGGWGTGGCARKAATPQGFSVLVCQGEDDHTPPQLHHARDLSCPCTQCRATHTPVQGGSRGRETKIQIKAAPRKANSTAAARPRSGAGVGRLSFQDPELFGTQLWPPQVKLDVSRMFSGLPKGK